jgi:hypothetical protein
VADKVIGRQRQRGKGRSARIQLATMVSAHCRTGLWTTKTETGKTPAETRRGNGRLGPVPRGFPTSETRPVSLTYGNILRSPAQGNDGAERPRWLAGAPGFEPGNGGIKIHLFLVIFQ